MKEEKNVPERIREMKKFVRYRDGAKMYSMGLTKFQELAKEAKAFPNQIRRASLNTFKMHEQSNNVFEICAYVDGLEKKLDSMTEELVTMCKQIDEMKEDTLLNNLKKSVSEAADLL